MRRSAISAMTEVIQKINYCQIRYVILTCCQFSRFSHTSYNVSILKKSFLRHSHVKSSTGKLDQKAKTIFSVYRRTGVSLQSMWTNRLKWWSWKRLRLWTTRMRDLVLTMRCTDGQRCSKHSNSVVTKSLCEMLARNRLA